MNDSINNYISDVKQTVALKERSLFLNQSLALVDKIKSKAKKNKSLLNTYKAISRELAKDLSNSKNSIEQLNALLDKVVDCIYNLQQLENKIRELQSNDLSIHKKFKNQVNSIVIRAHNDMTLANINSTISTVDDLIYEMEKYKKEQLEKRKRLKKNIFKYSLIIIGIAVAIYLIITYVVPFVVEYWWVILIVIVGIAYLMSRSMNDG